MQKLIPALAAIAISACSSTTTQQVSAPPEASENKTQVPAPAPEASKESIMSAAKAKARLYRTPGTPILFELNSADIQQAQYISVQVLANQIKENQPGVVMLRGYTDAIGATSYNLQLAKQRATAVKDALIVEGIKPEILWVVAEGEQAPLTPEKNPQQRKVAPLFLSWQKQQALHTEQNQEKLKLTHLTVDETDVTQLTNQAYEF